MEDYAVPDLAEEAILQALQDIEDVKGSKAYQELRLEEDVVSSRAELKRENYGASIDHAIDAKARVVVWSLTHDLDDTEHNRYGLNDFMDEYGIEDCARNLGRYEALKSVGIPCEEFAHDADHCLACAYEDQIWRYAESKVEPPEEKIDIRWVKNAFNRYREHHLNPEQDCTDSRESLERD